MFRAKTILKIIIKKANRRNISSNLKRQQNKIKNNFCFSVNYFVNRARMNTLSIKYDPLYLKERLTTITLMNHFFNVVYYHISFMFNKLFRKECLNSMTFIVILLFNITCSYAIIILNVWISTYITYNMNVWFNNNKILNIFDSILKSWMNVNNIKYE